MIYAPRVSWLRAYGDDLWPDSCVRHCLAMWCAERRTALFVERYISKHQAYYLVIRRCDIIPRGIYCLWATRKLSNLSESVVILPYVCCLICSRRKVQVWNFTILTYVNRFLLYNKVRSLKQTNCNAPWTTFELFKSIWQSFYEV